MEQAVRYIVNADDFGQTASCTKAIYEAIQAGLVTDTTMVANGDAFDMALDFMRKDPGLEKRIGIHMILTEGKPLTERMKNTPRFVTNGCFNNYLKSRESRLHPLSTEEKQAVYEELTAQVKRLRESGIRISHADSHHHVHCNCPFILPIFLRVCRENGIERVRLHKDVGRLSVFDQLMRVVSDRAFRRENKRTTDHFGGAGDYAAPAAGISEIMVHPDYDGEGRLIDRKRRIEKNGERIPEGPELAATLAPLTAGQVQPVLYSSL